MRCVAHRRIKIIYISRGHVYGFRQFFSRLNTRVIRILFSVIVAASTGDDSYLNFRCRQSTPENQVVEFLLLVLFEIKVTRAQSPASVNGVLVILVVGIESLLSSLVA